MAETGCDVLPDAFDGRCATCHGMPLTLVAKNASLGREQVPHPSLGPLVRDVYTCPEKHRTYVLHYGTGPT